MQSNVSILENVKKHFQEIEVEVNQQELQNAVRCIYDLMLDDELVIQLLVKATYPQSEFKALFNRRKTDREAL